jgi:hypothetical protein
MFENMDWKFVAIVVLLAILVIALIYVYVYSSDSYENFTSNSYKNSDNVPGDKAFYPTGEHSELLKVTSNQVNGSDEVTSHGIGGAAVQQEQSYLDSLYESQQGTELPTDLFPQNQLSAHDLLPADNNSIWAKVHPRGQGELADKNFLEAGYHIGINTTGQSLRNANQQIRSDPPNPQMKVSPWNQTTIEPDVSRRSFEIGSA